MCNRLCEVLRAQQLTAASSFKYSGGPSCAANAANATLSLLVWLQVVAGIHCTTTHLGGPQQVHNWHIHLKEHPAPAAEGAAAWSRGCAAQCSCCTGAISMHVLEQQHSFWANTRKCSSQKPSKVLDQCLLYFVWLTKQSVAPVQKAA